MNPGEKARTPARYGGVGHPRSGSGRMRASLRGFRPNPGCANRGRNNAHRGIRRQTDPCGLSRAHGRRDSRRCAAWIVRGRPRLGTGTNAPAVMPATSRAIRGFSDPRTAPVRPERYGDDLYRYPPPVSRPSASLKCNYKYPAPWIFFPPHCGDAPVYREPSPLLMWSIAVPDGFTPPPLIPSLPGLPPPLHPGDGGLDWAPCGGEAALFFRRRLLPPSRLSGLLVPAALSTHWIWLRSGPAPDSRRRRCLSRCAKVPGARLFVSIEIPRWPEINTPAAIGAFLRMREADWVWLRIYPEGQDRDRILSYLAYGRHNLRGSRHVPRARFSNSAV